MDFLPNKEKNLFIEVDGKKYARYPIKTKLITPEDKDITVIVQEYAMPFIKEGDIIFVSEKVVSVTQGRSYPLEEIKPSWLARFLSRFVMKTPAGIGLGSPETMQLAIEEVGILRILLSSFLGAVGKIFGVKGIFYIIAGHKARSIDGAVPYAIPPYNNYVSKGPLNAYGVARKISEKIGVSVAIVDANDLGINVLGFYGVDLPLQAGEKLIEKIIRDNPLGQSDEQTPIGIIRRQEQKYPNEIIRSATMADLNSITSIANLLYIDSPDFVWNSPKFIEKQINKGEYFVIEQNGLLIGIMSLRQRSRKMHIETLVIKSEFQSKGFGTSFIEFAKQYTKEQGLSKLRAYSFVDYNMANFYIKKGFTMLNHLGDYHGLDYQCFEIKLA